MGLTKTENFTTGQNAIATLAKVLGHPARIAILQHIIKADSCICRDLVNEIGLAQPTISQHLKELKSIGIIKGNIEGTRVCYCIDPIQWNRLRKPLMEFLNQAFLSIQECC